MRVTLWSAASGFPLTLFTQLSDTHVGFSGPPNPTGNRAFERAVEIVNRLPQTPDLILFTGDLTHDTEDPAQHAERMRQFQKIASRLKVPVRKMVPGEHDAGLDGGALYRQFFGASSYSFDHRGVHFVALDNVSRPKPEVGAEDIDWLRKDLAPYSATTPIVVFTDVVLTPQTAGRFTTICDHFCGSGHGNMKMTIVVE